VTDVRGGLIYLGLAGLIGYAWVTGTLANVVGYLTRAAGGMPAGTARLDPLHKIQLLPLRPGQSSSAGGSPIIRTASHPGGLTLLHT
jgi:hypothetical protein